MHAQKFVAFVSRALYALLACAAVTSCETGPKRIELPALPERGAVDAGKPVFTCKDEDSRTCDGTTFYSCKRSEEFIEATSTDCAEQDEICDLQKGCVVCIPDTFRCQACKSGDASCNPDTIQKCSADAAWVDQKVCDIDEGFTCDGARCVNACDLAKDNRSYEGCVFYAADLDNAAIDDVNNASAQQYAVAIANPQRIAVEVYVELNTAAYGKTPKLQEIARKLVPPGDIEVFALPRREVDGSSATGLNDGTHTAVTSNAYRLTSSHPITAYQFNPLENVSVFSNDASLLLPTSAIGSQYTVVAWPQTIGTSKNPEQDFDSTSSDEDLRSFLTIIGTTDATRVKVELGALVVKVEGAGPVPKSKPGDVLELDIGPFDVVNLETSGFNADFTGTLVTATQPVTVFVGSEASDVPMFDTYATRQCCADHLEEQLLPDASAGARFIIARMPQRTRALNAAALPGSPLGVANTDELEWVRVVAIADGDTKVQTTLPKPDKTFTLKQGENRMLPADRDFVIDAEQPIAVLHALPSQGVSGIPRQYPGGDPSIITPPPVEQYRRDYIFLTPDKYAFDFVTIVARKGASVVLDGAPLPKTCETSEVVGDDKRIDGLGEWVVHRCQLSFPEVTAGPGSVTRPGEQHDGVHTVVSNREMGIVVYGFDRFVSYAYVGGLNLDVLN